jgi:uncharacterized membrane-anchored protein
LVGGGSDLSPTQQPSNAAFRRLSNSPPPGTIVGMPDSSLTRRTLVKVPEVTVMFWVLKLLTTGMGESMSDFLGNDINVAAAAVIGIGGLWLALRLQLRQTEYRAPYYWFTVMMVAIFGTMAADGIHDGAGIGYDVTTPLFGLITAAIFLWWYRTEGTLSIHEINSPRRERFYWLAVLGTFALGTAAGDLTATSINIGFLNSVWLFAGIILIPLIGWWKLRFNAIFAFWFAYVDTRPFGASVADWVSKPHNITGLNFGDGHTSAVALAVFLVLVTAITVTRFDVQAGDNAESKEHPHQVPVFAHEAE